jgi:hypothetical protein
MSVCIKKRKRKPTYLRHIDKLFILLRHFTGIQNLEPGDDMHFFWKFWCQFPALQEKKTYIIIGKDGYKVINDEGQM